MAVLSHSISFALIYVGRVSSTYELFPFGWPVYWASMLQDALYFGEAIASLLVGEPFLNACSWTWFAYNCLLIFEAL